MRPTISRLRNFIRPISLIARCAGLKLSAAALVLLLALAVMLAHAPLRDAGAEVANGAATAPRWYADEHVARGAEVFTRHCAGCHGDRGQGASKWRRRGADGNFPPPPLNGTGHAWHHPSAVLLRAIMEGGSAVGGTMPGWRGVISPDDAAAAIAWFQSQWPDEIYAAWYRIEMDSRRGQ